MMGRFRIGVWVVALLCVLPGPVVELCGEGITWDHLPTAVYEDESIHLHGRVPLAGGRTAVLRTGEAGAAHATTICDAEGVFRFAAPVLDERDRLVVEVDGHHEELRLVRPGDPVGLQVGPEALADERQRRVILVLRRREATEDRRWALLRGDESPDFERKVCACHLRAPSGVAWGGSALLRQIADLGGVKPRGQAVLLELGNEDVYHGWRLRSYRQILAWLIADLRARGARRIVLVQPPVVDLDRDRAWPLRRQVIDVARSYDCEVVQVEELHDRRFWELQPGVLGRSLNEAGRRAYASLCAPYLAGGARE